MGYRSKDGAYNLQGLRRDGGAWNGFSRPLRLVSIYCSRSPERHWMDIGHCFGGVSGRCGWKPASAPATSMEMGEETQLLRRSRIGRAIRGTPEPWVSHGSPASGRTDRALLECWVSGGISTQSGTVFSTGRPALTGSDQRPAGQTDAAQFERAAAVRTHGGLPGLDLNFWCEKESIGKLDQPPDGFDVHLAPREATGSHLHFSHLQPPAKHFTRVDLKFVDFHLLCDPLIHLCVKSVGVTPFLASGQYHVRNFGLSHRGFRRQ
jgi:hypothetical protein